MEVRTFRAATIQEALALVRSELGPEAAVLQTRHVPRRGLWNRLRRRTEVEVTASLQVKVPSRVNRPEPAPASVAAPSPAEAAPAPRWESQELPRVLSTQLSQLEEMVARLYQESRAARVPEVPEPLFDLFTELLDRDLPEQAAKQLVQQLAQQLPPEELHDPLLVRGRLHRLVESRLKVAGPIQLVPGQRRVVALVGPTGVGKTTTIAKLAANFRLRQRRSVGLITVDTYRIAAVEQLRTYAQIIDLPMVVVGSPGEMAPALAQLGQVELVLIDTAGRSPRDEVKLHELKAFLTLAQADEVHLVLSASAGANTLLGTARRFDVVGPNRLLLTKLDEAAALGHLLPVLEQLPLPLSYLTDGQNVPDDIQAARADRLAAQLLGEQNG